MKPVLSAVAMTGFATPYDRLNALAAAQDTPSR